MSRFTDQRRMIATAAECVGPWGGAKNGARFRCHLCGCRFKVGDGWRWVMGGSSTFRTEDGKKFGLTNFKVCDQCDGPDVVDRWKARNEEFYSTKFWALQ